MTKKEHFKLINESIRRHNNLELLAILNNKPISTMVKALDPSFNDNESISEYFIRKTKKDMNKNYEDPEKRLEFKETFCAKHHREMEEKEQAIKHDKGKIRMELLPPHALEEIAKVFTHGAEKYEDFNYLKGKGLDLNRLYGACLRHLNSWKKGELNDKESNYSHISHAACCLMMILEIENKNK